MQLWIEAFIFGLLSAASFPLGSVLGIQWSPTRPDVIAGLVAFGAGALLFAVTIEIYGHLLTEFHHGAIGQALMVITILATFGGSAAYIYLNDFLEKMMETEEEEEHATGRGSCQSVEEAHVIVHGKSDEEEAHVGLKTSDSQSSFGKSDSSASFDGGMKDAATVAGMQEITRQRTSGGVIPPVAAPTELDDARGRHHAAKAKQTQTGRRGTIQKLAQLNPASAQEFAKMEGRKARMSCLVCEVQQRTADMEKRSAPDFGDQKKPAAGYGTLETIQSSGSTPKDSPKDSPRSSTISTKSASDSKTQGDMRLAMAMFLGLVVDGIPEAILLGFLAAKRELGHVLIISLFLANFPEAFSSSSLMSEANVKPVYIIGMWSALCLLTGILSALACAFILSLNADGHGESDTGFWIQVLVSAVEGLAGGAMICCISAVMLPEAYERRNKHFKLMSPGFLAASGFLSALALKVFGEGLHENPFEGQHSGHHFFFGGPDPDQSAHAVLRLVSNMLRR